MTRHGASTSPGAFPGFGADAPLDLPDLTAAQEAGIVSRIAGAAFAGFAATDARVGSRTTLSGTAAHQLPQGPRVG